MTLESSVVIFQVLESLSLNNLDSLNSLSGLNDTYFVYSLHMNFSKKMSITSGCCLLTLWTCCMTCFSVWPEYLNLEPNEKTPVPTKEGETWEEYMVC